VAEVRCGLARRFLALARRRPDAPALLDPEGRMMASRASLASEAAIRAERFAPSIPAGGVVVLSLSNSPEMVTIFLGLRMLGVRVALEDATAPAEELMRCADVIGAARIVAGPQRFAGERVAYCSGDVAVVRHTPAHRPPLSPRAAVLKVTSGSTGLPRVVVLSTRQLAADAVQIMRTMGFDGDDVTLAAVPLSHSYGLGSCLAPLLLAGTPLVPTGALLPGALAATLAAARIVHFPAVPAMVRALVGLGNLPPLPDLRVCLSAGAPLSPSDAAAFHALTGTKVHVFYGSSECGGIAYDRSPEAITAAGYVGTPMERVRITLVDGRGRELPVGEEGRVAVYSRAVALATVPSPAGRAELRPGRFLTGDLGRLDERNGLTLTGRIAEILNVAGKKVHPDEVRTVLRTHPGVHEAAVVGLADPHRGQLVAAAVVAEPGFTLEVPRLLAWCRQRLAPHKVPRRLAVVDVLPVTARGKLDREALVRRLAAAAGARAER
jgi:long-chain acyl-CoA synthetase